MASRKKAIEAESKSGSSGVGSSDVSRKLIESNKLLIKSIKELEKAVKAGRENTRGAGERAGMGRGGGGGGEATVGGMGGIGASIPVLGAVMAVAAFTMQKVAQIGHAYLSKAGEQAGTAGVGGFQAQGYGMYNAAQIGAGLKSSAMNSGKFGNGTMGPGETTAMQVGGIFGLSAEETFGHAGTLTRAGGSYANVANVGAGAGIQTQLPMFISAIAGELEEAVKNGMNSSDIAGTIAQDLAAVVQATGNKDVTTALNITKSMSSLLASGRKGQVDSLEGMLAWKGSQKKMLGDMNTDREGSVNALLKNDVISQEEADKLKGIKGNITGQDIDSALGPGGLTYLTKNRMQSQGEAGTFAVVAEGLKETFGTGRQAMRTASNISDSMGGIGSTEVKTAYNMGKSSKSDQEAGAAAIAAKHAGVVSGEAGMSINLQNQMEAELLLRGKAFAAATVEAETGLISLAEVGIKGVSEGFKSMEEGMKKIKGLMDEVTAAGGLGEWIKDKINPFN